MVRSKRSNCLALFYIILLIYLLLKIDWKRNDPINSKPGSIDYARIRLQYNDRIAQIRHYCHANQDNFPEQTYLKSQDANKKMYLHLKSKDVYLHYCGIGKVGGGTWRHNLDQLLSDDGESIQTANSYLSDYEIDSRQKLSFVFVRNPIARLASAYYDKMFRNWSDPLKMDSWPWRKYILMKYRHLTKEQAIADSKVVTEQEFATFIVEEFEEYEGSNLAFIDPHWRPQTAICPFCFYNFDIIGKMETFAQDRDFIYKTINKEVSNCNL